MNRVFRWMVCLGVMMMLGTAGPRAVADRTDAAAEGGITGTVADESGARLPGVSVEVVVSQGSRAIASATTDAQGVFRIERVPTGEYWLQLTLPGFATNRQKVAVQPGTPLALSATLSVDRLTEVTSVSAQEVRLDASRPTQAVSFSSEMLADVPTPSRNYTHVIVAEAGVSAPLPEKRFVP